VGKQSGLSAAPNQNGAGGGGKILNGGGATSMWRKMWAERTTLAGKPSNQDTGSSGSETGKKRGRVQGVS